MLPKKNRIREEVDFGLICRHGKTQFFDKIVLKIKKNDLGVMRLGISVGLKFSPKAVERNRIKRQIREFFRVNLGKIEPHMDIVVIVQKGANEKKDLSVKLEESLLKSGVINNLSPAVKKQLGQTKNGIFI